LARTENCYAQARNSQGRWLDSRSKGRILRSRSQRRNNRATLSTVCDEFRRVYGAGSYCLPRLVSVRRVAAIDLFVMPQRWLLWSARITSFFALLIGTLRRKPSAARIIARASFTVSVPIVASSVLSVLFILSSYGRGNAGFNLRQLAPSADMISHPLLPRIAATFCPKRCRSSIPRVLFHWQSETLACIPAQS
jgi:hypothetical protein